jgi:SSS family solute:Na+ symporter
MAWGTYMAEQLQLKSSVYPLHIFGGTYAMYAAVPALVLNLAIAAVGTLIARAFNAHCTADATVSEDYSG